MKFIKNIFLTLLLSCFGVSNLSAHEGEDHGAKKPAANSTTLTHFTTFAVSDKFEAVLYYGHIEAGEETTLTLFLSDFATNAPINKAQIDISISGEKGDKFTVTQKDSGTYLLKGVFPANKIYNLNANIAAGNIADLLLIRNVEVGKELPQANENNAPETTEEHSEISPLLYALGGMFLGGIIIWILMSKRNKTAR